MPLQNDVRYAVRAQMLTHGDPGLSAANDQRIYRFNRHALSLVAMPRILRWSWQTAIGREKLIGRPNSRSLELSLQTMGLSIRPCNTQLIAWRDRLRMKDVIRQQRRGLPAIIGDQADPHVWSLVLHQGYPAWQADIG